MNRHHLPAVWLEKEEAYTNGVKTGEYGITIEPNQDASCFSLRQTHASGDEDEIIHFCDWRELVKQVTEFMTEREQIAREDGEWHGH